MRFKMIMGYVNTPQLNLVREEKKGFGLWMLYITAHPLVLSDLMDWWKNVPRDGHTMPIKLAAFKVNKKGIGKLRFHPATKPEEIMLAFQAKAMLTDYLLRNKAEYPTTDWKTWLQVITSDYYFESKPMQELNKGKKILHDYIVEFALQIMHDQLDAETKAELAQVTF